MQKPDLNLNLEIPIQGFIIGNYEFKANDNGNLSLTELWKLLGSKREKKPFEWLRWHPGQRYCEKIAKELKSARPSMEVLLGRCGGTWAHPKIFIAYAQWLSPECYAQIVDKMIKSSELIENLLEALSNMDLEDVPPDRFIYAAQDSRGRLKIGISKHPEQRIQQLNIGHPDLLKLVYVRPAHLPGYGSEIEAHNLAWQYKIRSEWFKPEALELLPK